MPKDSQPDQKKIRKEKQSGPSPVVRRNQEKSPDVKKQSDLGTYA